MATYFTADFHLFHGGIIERCNRPFSGVAEMNAVIVENINARCTRGDDLYILGDVSWRKAKLTLPLLEQLRPRLHLVRGNHDPNANAKLAIWRSAADYREINLAGRKLVLSHYPFETWNGSRRGSLHLHGHSHGKLPARPGRLDVGVDCWDFQPVTIDDVLARLEDLFPSGAAA